MADDGPTNGWRSGRDPVQRRLRIVTVVVCLGVFAYLAIDPDRTLDVIPTAGLALGAVLLLLGYEGAVRLPGIGRKDDK
jgi:hypothetical protein